MDQFTYNPNYSVWYYGKNVTSIADFNATQKLQADRDLFMNRLQLNGALAILIQPFYK